MKILITGGTGTLGKPLATELTKRGHDVWTCGRSHGEYKHIRCDVAEARQVESVFQQVKPDVCYHFAAEFGRINGQHYPEQLWKTNCLGTRNVIESCLDHDTRLIFSSSSEAYGDLADTGRLVEYRLDKEVPRFHNEYALSKWTNEQQIQTAIKNQGLNATILRFFNIYGPGEKYSEYRSVVCLFIYRALRDMPVTVYTGTHRSFLFVDDWAAAVANVVDAAAENGEAFNIGSEEYVDLATLWDAVVEVVGGTEPGAVASPVLRIKNEVSNIADKLPDIRKAKTRLGMKESVTLREGLKRTADWMRSEYARSLCVA